MQKYSLSWHFIVVIAAIHKSIFKQKHFATLLQNFFQGERRKEILEKRQCTIRSVLGWRSFYNVNEKRAKSILSVSIWEDNLLSHKIKLEISCRLSYVAWLAFKLCLLLRHVHFPVWCLCFESSGWALVMRNLVHSFIPLSRNNRNLRPDRNSEALKNSF